MSFYWQLEGVRKIQRSEALNSAGVRVGKRFGRLHGEPVAGGLRTWRKVEGQSSIKRFSMVNGESLA